MPFSQPKRCPHPISEPIFSKSQTQFYCFSVCDSHSQWLNPSPGDPNLIFPLQICPNPSSHLTPSGPSYNSYNEDPVCYHPAICCYIVATCKTELNRKCFFSRFLLSITPVIIPCRVKLFSIGQTVTQVDASSLVLAKRTRKFTRMCTQVLKKRFKCYCLRCNSVLEVDSKTYVDRHCVATRWKTCVDLRANLISIKVNASRRNPTQVHASSGQMETKVDVSWKLASTCASVWPGFLHENMTGWIIPFPIRVHAQLVKINSWLC